MRNPFHLTLDSSLGDIDVLTEQIDAFAAARELSPDLCGEVQLALEEIVSNIIKHGYRDVAGHAIVVTMNVEKNQLVIHVEDSAPRFNPLDAPDPDIAKPMAEKQPGGLGIHLVKRIMTSVNYEYADGKNRLTLRKGLDQ